MRLTLVAALGLMFACATASPAPTASAAGGCAQATVSGGTVVYSAPDPTSTPLETLTKDTQMCVDPQVVGFGLQHVKLADGRDGYIAGPQTM